MKYLFLSIGTFFYVLISQLYIHDVERLNDAYYFLKRSEMLIPIVLFTFCFTFVISLCWLLNNVRKFFGIIIGGVLTIGITHICFDGSLKFVLINGILGGIWGGATKQEIDVQLKTQKKGR